MSVEFKMKILKILFFMEQNVKNYGECIYGLVFHHTFRGHVTHDLLVVWKYFFNKKLPNQICVTYPKIFGCTPRLCMKKIPNVPHACTIKQLSVHLNLFFFLMEEFNVYRRLRNKMIYLIIRIHTTMFLCTTKK